MTREKVTPLKKMVGPLAPTQYQHKQGFTVAQVLVLVLTSFVLGVMLTNYAPVLLHNNSSGLLSSVANIVSGTNQSA